jgi:hypothetical protein
VPDERLLGGEYTSESDEKTRRKERIFKLEQPVKDATASQLATANAKIRQLEQSLANQTNHLRRLEAETKAWREQMEATIVASIRGKQTWTERASSTERNAAANELGTPTVEPHAAFNQSATATGAVGNHRYLQARSVWTVETETQHRVTGEKSMSALFRLQPLGKRMPAQKRCHPTQDSINCVEIQESGTTGYLEILLKGSITNALTLIHWH